MNTTPVSSEEWAPGFCQCGCGGRTRSATLRFIHGHHNRVRIVPNPIERITAKIEIRDDGCWVWTGGKNKGYGRISIDGKHHYIHRVVYALALGDIPEGLTLDHLCRNPACCNPAHLEPVTQAENVRRGKGTKGRQLSVETRQKMSIARRGKKRGPYRKHSAEANAQKSERQKARFAVMTPEERRAAAGWHV